MFKSDHPVLNFIYKHFKTNFFIFIGICILILIIVFFIIPKEYTANVSILPSATTFSQGFMDKLGSLGKFAGVDLSTSSGRSQEMYDGIIHSNKLIDDIIYREHIYWNGNDTVSTDLFTFFEIDAENERERKEKIQKKMKEDVIQVNIDAENDILYLGVTTEDPFLSALLANQIIEVLNDLVKNEVQKEFHQKMTFLRKRLDEIQDSLKIAERDLKIFLENNIDPTLPAFQIEQLRKRRSLELQTELYIEFRKQIEVFLADNLINLADIKVLDKAYPPYRKSRPKRALLSIAFAILAGFMQLGVNVSVLYYRNYKQELSGSAFEKT